MWTGIIAAALVAWIVVSFYATGKKKGTQDARQVGFFFLIYGLVLGVLIGSWLKG